MFFNGDGLGRSKVPHQSNLLAPAKHPPARIKFKAVQAKARAFGKGMMIIMPALAETYEAKERHGARNIMTLDAMGRNVKGARSIIMGKPSDKPMTRNGHHNTCANAPSDPAHISPEIEQNANWNLLEPDRALQKNHKGIFRQFIWKLNVRPVF